MPKVVLISVPHTGTWFTIRLFKGLNETNLVPSVIEDDTIYHGHMLKGTQVCAALRLAKMMPLVCPLRHPYRVEESWKRRGKDIAEMIECFRIYQDKFIPLDPYIMPVDSPYRGEALLKMSLGLDVPFVTDWPVVNGKKDTHDIPLEDLSPSQTVIELVQDMQPFLSRFYGHSN